MWRAELVFSITVAVVPHLLGLARVAPDLAGDSARAVAIPNNTWTMVEKVIN